ncbi:pantothenate kinase [Dehalococcoides mccartyi]|jgi:transcriptional activator, putative, Baf family|nr:type III pantothenate kinase [Dehalococcoides mccartyi]AGG07500.1 type III pantothenate kinase [Dehalococcoides mccartyi BTF08]AQW62067.1 pantothenate kinase [Dehalococcoides mccartyi]AQX74248.1 pantothenate kinase [Dehalococcoides mccartyi]AQY72824.1 pantothenate kinase [Dehalococcoides mccartyi]KSV16703.1 pantothenate kinase [Dehalococcoides mccartyi]
MNKQASTEKLVAVDIGNTSVNIGIFEGEQLLANWHLGSVAQRMADEYASLLLGLLQHADIQAGELNRVIMCSVVPPLTTTFEEVFKTYFKATPLVVGAGIKSGVKIRMDNPREVGADRIVNAAAARVLYPGACIIVDMGTATTFDTLSESGEYIGGAIAPGIATSAQAIVEKTSKLPKIEIIHPAKAIGSNTVSAMQSGVYFGYIGLVEELVRRIQAELGQKARVVATGGYASLIAEGSRIFDIVRPDLTLQGLRFIYQMNKV